jgi:predicted acyltransferase
MAASGLPRPAAIGLKDDRKTALRYLALDAMRGFVMLVLVSHAFGLGEIKDPRYQGLALKFEHLRWDGLVPWELIMPSFMLMIGTALPFAMARRLERGATRTQLLSHAAVRMFKLILLGQFLTCYHQGRWAYEPYETLTQLALSYMTCFLILQLPFRGQPVAAAGLMALNWGLYLLFPGSQGPFSGPDNVGAVIDRAVFHLDHAWDWATINFLGSGITVLFGAWAGVLVRSERPAASKLKIMSCAAAACLAIGLLLLPVNPVIHKAWTASFTFFHTACVLSGLALFFWLFDVGGWRRAAFPLVVVGANSIFIYMCWQLLNGWISKTLAIFTGGFEWFGAAAPALQQCAVGVVLWTICYWLYRRSIFFKV